ncbi:hypothetical protein D3C71_1663430 [compost metagenome]
MKQLYYYSDIELSLRQIHCINKLSKYSFVILSYDADEPPKSGLMISKDIELIIDISLR